MIETKKTKTYRTLKLLKARLPNAQCLHKRFLKIFELLVEANTKLLFHQFTHSVFNFYLKLMFNQVKFLGQLSLLVAHWLFVVEDRGLEPSRFNILTFFVLSCDLVLRHMQLSCAYLWKEIIYPLSGFEPRTF